MPNPEYLYLVAEDLYRLGNASAARLDHVRSQDVDLFEQNGVPMVRSNGKGISLLTEARMARVRGGGWVWKIPRQAQLVEGLAISPDADPTNTGHLLLCPRRDMPLAQYQALLAEMGGRCERIRKL